MKSSRRKGIADSLPSLDSTSAEVLCLWEFVTDGKRHSSYAEKSRGRSGRRKLWYSMGEEMYLPLLPCFEFNEASVTPIFYLLHWIGEERKNNSQSIKTLFKKFPCGSSNLYFLLPLTPLGFFLVRTRNSCRCTKGSFQQRWKSSLKTMWFPSFTILFFFFLLASSDPGKWKNFW